MEGKLVSRRPHVALIVETSVVYGREILKGISRYLSTHEPWSVFLDERELDSPPPKWLLDWKGDGVICRSTTPALADELRIHGLHVVDLNDRHGDLGFPRITSDMNRIGKIAAEYLIDRGFQNIAYCGFEGEAWSEARLEGVQTCIAPCSVFRSPWKGLREHSWQEERDRVSAWLSRLPRPLGIVTCNDVRGYHVLDACRTLGLAVPEEVAVIGVDNAETFCTLCDPPLSSVVPDAERIGYEAAQLLNGLMSGQAASKLTVTIPPKGIHARHSTDSVAITDPVVVRAARYIRENAHQTIGVSDVLAHSRVSRSTLERKFRACLGRSPHDEIERVRLKRIKTLLIETDWSLARIAENVGYEHSEYMMVQFKRETGLTPTEWRVTKNLSELG